MRQIGNNNSFVSTGAGVGWTNAITTVQNVTGVVVRTLAMARLSGLADGYALMVRISDGVTNIVVHCDDSIYAALPDELRVPPGFAVQVRSNSSAADCWTTWDDL